MLLFYVSLVVHFTVLDRQEFIGKAIVAANQDLATSIKMVANNYYLE
ncbi:hypothetical protein C3B55_00914 [Candidatus Pseudomonas adelgestsugas]|uniref:Uncharacterized protein n=1 Tax=Candidatus Pseudomonas adelgestsugas TaxID=1302376 RepID=A0ABX5R989_9PSED|nr:hypothetical protein C3B55_00914 [Candidatus Pseudomonas adelgestsugas]